VARGDKDDWRYHGDYFPVLVLFLCRMFHPGAFSLALFLSMTEVLALIWGVGATLDEVGDWEWFPCGN